MTVEGALAFLALMFTFCFVFYKEYKAHEKTHKELMEANKQLRIKNALLDIRKEEDWL